MSLLVAMKAAVKLASSAVSSATTSSQPTKAIGMAGTEVTPLKRKAAAVIEESREDTAQALQCSNDKLADPLSCSTSSHSSSDSSDSIPPPIKKLKTSCSQQHSSQGKDSKNDNKVTNLKRRVSFSEAQKIVEFDVVEDHEKQLAWYAEADYSEFITSAHEDAQLLKMAAQRATSAQSLFCFIQSRPDLSPRGLEKLLHACHGSDDEDDEDNSNNINPTQQQDAAFPVQRHSKRVRSQKTRHRQLLLEQHRNQKESGECNPEKLRQISEDSSRWSVETALKLGHIDAKGLI